MSVGTGYGRYYRADGKCNESNTNRKSGKEADPRVKRFPLHSVLGDSLSVITQLAFQRCMPVKRAQRASVLSNISVYTVCELNLLNISF